MQSNQLVAKAPESPGKDKNAMAFIPVPNCVEVEIVQELFGQIIENTLYFSREAEWEVAEMEVLANAAEAWWIDQIRPLVTADLLLREVDVTDLSTATSPSFPLTVAPGTSGELAEPGMPGNVCLAVSFRTAGRGRSARGRNYVSGLVDSQCVGNDVTGSVASDFAAAYANLLEVATLPADVTWVVASRFHNNAPRVTGIVIPIVSVIVVDTALDSQRRRLRGRGD